MKFLGLLLIICLTGHIQSDGLLDQIERGLDEFSQNNIKPDYLQNAIDSIFKIKNKSTRNKSICSTCVVITNALLKLRKNGATRETLLKYAQNLCLWFISNKKSLCEGSLDLQIDAALYIVDKNPDLTAEHICAIRLQEYGCTDPEYDSWSINIPPQSTNYKPSINNDTKQEDIVLHLTDLHYDPLYEPGANTECDYFICCQSANGKAENQKNGAGYWGDYKICDTPMHSILDLFKQVTKQHPKIDRVYYTGDLVSHQLWETSKKNNSDSIKTIMKELKATFKTIPVFPVLGNHEAHPSDLFSPPHVTDEGLSTQWLLDLVAEEWASFLPNTTQSTIRKGGYYTVLVKPGFRVIGLNSNLCYTANLWLINDNKDPNDQLQWLVNTLADAEKNNESVHIVSHVPPGDKACLWQWNHEYRRIVERFSNTISGQFHGHTHQDQLKIFYSVQNPYEVVNVAFIGGSFTSFVGMNPSYRVYNIESSTWRVNDYEHWIYNLEEANKFSDQPPNWFKLYSFKDAYGLDNLNLASYHKLIQKMASNTSLIEQYRRFQVRDSPPQLNKPCDKECLSDIFCSITKIEYEESLQCKAFKTKFYKI